MNRAQSDFARVYDDHVWRVYGFLAYRLRDRETAEDMTQATFERALRAWSRFDPRRASESTWLLTIARNLLIDHQRRDRSAVTDQIDERVLPAVPGPESRIGGSPELVRGAGSARRARARDPGAPLRRRPHRAGGRRGARADAGERPADHVAVAADGCGRCWTARAARARRRRPCPGSWTSYRPPAACTRPSAIRTPPETSAPPTSRCRFSGRGP